VDGQEAEELRIDVHGGKVRVLALASEPLRRVLLPGGGVAKIPATGTEEVLKKEEIARLIEMTRSLQDRFPMLRGEQGRAAPADVEFGFYKGRLALFQIRPFLESLQARQNLFLNSLDRPLTEMPSRMVDLDKVPGEKNQ